MPRSTIRYCDISNVENGIWAEANNVLIENNYIHDLAGGSEAHIDGIQFPQVTPAIHDVIIRNNNINLRLIDHYVLHNHDRLQCHYG